MSLDLTQKPPQAVQCSCDLEKLITQVVETTVACLEATTLQSPYLSSRDCAELIGVTPEHLCAMRAKGEGPPWSGAGRWIRYERKSVLDWLASLPTTKRDICSSTAVCGSTSANIDELQGLGAHHGENNGRLK